MSKYGMTDSGKRQSFGTGMARDTADDKPRPDLISPFAEEQQDRGSMGARVRRAEETGMPFALRCLAQAHVMSTNRAAGRGPPGGDHVQRNGLDPLRRDDRREELLPAELNNMPCYQPAARKSSRTAKEGGNPVAGSIVRSGHLNGCLMAAVDLETTGTRPGYHEIIRLPWCPGLELQAPCRRPFSARQAKTPSGSGYASRSTRFP
jgi:hypothetical protein